MTSRLNPADQKHVEEYLQLSQHRVERRPLRLNRLIPLITRLRRKSSGLTG